MLTPTDIEITQKRSLEYLQRAGVVVTAAETRQIRVTDFGLDDQWQLGLQWLPYLDGGQLRACELVLFPWQTCPEHRHTPAGEGPGKEETLRCRWGTVYLYVPGKAAVLPRAQPPERRRDYFTVWHEIVLRPGDQVTIPPDTLHWFQSGAAGAVISEFASLADERWDFYTDPQAQAAPELVG